MKRHALKLVAYNGYMPTREPVQPVHHISTLACMLVFGEHKRKDHAQAQAISLHT